MKIRWVIISGFLSVMAIVALYMVSASTFKTIEVQRAQNRLTLYRSTLLNALEQFQHLPFVLAQDPLVIKAAAGADRDKLNVRLEAFARRAGLEAIYLLDTTGLTVSASNHSDVVTFIGENYGYRPYFKQAMLGHRGSFFGIGATTSRPGYFLAELVRGTAGEALGVIVIKLDLTALQQAWSSGGETVFVSNQDGVVILSSNSDWLYQTMTPIDEKMRRKIAAGRQFRNQPLTPLKWSSRDPDKMKINGTTYVHVTSTMMQEGWLLHYLADESRVRERTLFAVITGGIALSLLLTAFAFIRSKRIRQALEASQKDRRLLIAGNLKLEREVEERRSAERRLEKVQSALTQATKLAALGQLSASVTHELGQPIAAMRNYLTAAEFDKDNTDHSHTMNRMGAIVKRMENITKQLRFFARPTQDRMEPLDLCGVIDGAREMMMHDLTRHDIELKIDVPDGAVFVQGNRLRLEQVLVNLISNSITAMEDTLDREIIISISARGGKAVLMVDDSGYGIGDRSIEQLQEPFHTTQASGQGMGLGLAITASIIKEHQGAMSAMNLAAGGARFTVELPLIPQEDQA